MKTFIRSGLMLLTGVAIGAVSLHFYHVQHSQEALGRTLDSWGFEMSTGKIIHIVNTLTYLRRGETEEVLDRFEKDLSSEIWLLSLGFPQQTLTDTNCVRILKAAARYRTEHPFKSGDADRDRAVEGLLSKLD